MSAFVKVTWFATIEQKDNFNSVRSIFLNYVSVYSLGCWQNIEIDSRHFIHRLINFVYVDFDIFLVNH